jgi:hypothetical protein
VQWLLGVVAGIALLVIALQTYYHFTPVARSAEAMALNVRGKARLRCSCGAQVRLINPCSYATFLLNRRFTWARGVKLYFLKIS